MSTTRWLPGCLLLTLGALSSGCGVGADGPLEKTAQEQAPQEGAPASCIQRASEPDCSSPAPLLTVSQRAPGYIVVFHDEAVCDASAVTTSLEQRYGFTATFRYTAALKGFSAELSDAQLAAVRCESAVDYVEENAAVSVGG